MNREIKFRAWQSQEKKMYVQGDAVDENRKVFWDIWENKTHISEPMQFTGLKDKNGKEVYEGDICRYSHDKDSKEYTGTIFYKSNSACFHLKTGDDSSFALLGHQKEIKVIGNIYETPELINCKNGH